MIIKEYIEFERGQNPKKSLRIGIHHLIPQIIEKFEESPFELTRRGEVLDLEQKYEVSPENFHNPAGYPKYDWEFADIMEDFEVSILYMIDLNNGEILRKMKVSNSRIDAEYIDNENWKITSLNPNKIYEEIDQDYALIDIADAAEYLWDAYQKQTEEEEFEDEGLDESLDFVRGIVDKKYNVFYGPASKVHERLDFERGMDPKQSMDIGRFAKINKITSSDLEFLKIYTNDGDGKDHVNEKFFEEVYQDSSGFPKYLERVREVYQILEPFEYLFGDHFPSDMKKEMREYVKSYLKNPKYNYAYNCDIMGDGDIDVFFSEIKLPSAELLGKKSGLKESVNFERGIDPKKSMQIGVKAKIKHGMNCLLQSSRNFSSRISTINLAGDRNNLWLEISDYGTPNFEDFIESCLSPEYFEQIYLKAKPRKYKSTSQNKWVLVIKTQYKSAFRACFDNQGYIIESVNFERGLDKEKLRIGNIRPVEKLKKDYDNIQELVQTSKYLHFQIPFSKEALEAIPDTNHFGWGNIQNNFKNMSREELFPFELIVRKYKKLMGLDES